MSTAKPPLSREEKRTLCAVYCLTRGTPGVVVTIDELKAFMAARGYLTMTDDAFRVEHACVLAEVKAERAAREAAAS